MAKALWGNIYYKDSYAGRLEEKPGGGLYLPMMIPTFKPNILRLLIPFLFKHSHLFLIMAYIPFLIIWSLRGGLRMHKQGHLVWTQLVVLRSYWGLVMI